jgi:hypothetical protein
VSIPPTAVLAIRRLDQEPSKWVKWELMLDGVAVAAVKNGQRVELRISPGTHVVAVRSSGRRVSREIAFEVAAESLIELAACASRSRINRFGRLWRGTPIVWIERWGPGTTHNDSA